MTLKKIVCLFVFGMTMAPVPADAIIMKFDFLQDDKHQHENDSLKAACEVCNPPKKDEKGKKESVQLTLSNGKVLDINKHTELEILKYIYGDNESGYVYSKLDK